MVKKKNKKLSKKNTPKKSGNKHGSDRKAEHEKRNVHTNEAGVLVKKTHETKKDIAEKKTDKPGIELKEKIKLPKSEHSYKSFFYRRYAKYINRAKKPTIIILKIAAVIFAVIFAVIALLFLIFGRDLPDVGKLKSMNFDETTRIYDRNGNILYSIFDEENRKYVSLNYIAPMAINATLAIEDKNFYKHFGFDPVGIIRAQITNMKEDSMSQGASTITQQLAKNIFLSHEKTYERKIKELLLSMEIELLYSKEEILEMYLNKISYGSNSYGIEAASETYFGKTSKDLNLAESAILASLPKAPSYFSPHGQNRKELMGSCGTPVDPNEKPDVVDNEEILSDGPTETTVLDPPIDTKSESFTQEMEQVVEEEQKCLSIEDPNYVWGRKDYVLQRMVDDGYITKEQMNEAWKQALDLTFKDPKHKIEAPHFVFYVKELLEQKYGKEMVESGGLEVRTTLDPTLQSLAEESIALQAPTNLRYFRANNAGLVAIDPKSGQVLAMVGSVDYWDTTINGQVNTTTSSRQPGSSFKPLIYAAAIQTARIGSGTILGDYKTVFNKKDVPRNSDNTYKGRMTIRNALSQSRNIPAIKAYYLAGEEDKVLEFLGKIGLGSLKKFKDDFNATSQQRGWTFNYGWPMAIGSGEVRLLDLAGAYGALANGGKFVPINPILEVRDRKGNILEKAEIKEGDQVIDAQAAYIVSSIISDSAARPAGSWRNTLTIPGHTVAAKTGTSNKKVGNSIYPNNNLIMGYTPSIVLGVWVGNTDGSQMRGDAWAFKDVGPIWRHFIETFLKDKPDEPFPEPPGIKHIGREVYPENADLKTNFDGKFKQATQQTHADESATQAVATAPDASWVTTADPTKKPTTTKPTAAPSAITPAPDLPW
jgi:penicillin-binding protein 1A